MYFRSGKGISMYMMGLQTEKFALVTLTHSGIAKLA